MAYRAILVDDEELAVKRLQRLLRDEADVEIVGTAENGRRAIELVDELKPDLLFLDIQMPGLTGFDVIRKLHHIPVVIFTTAYDEYALKAFETSAVDYLLKPIEKARLQKALEKLKMLRPAEIAGELGPRLDLLLKTMERKQAESFLTHIPAKLGERILFFASADVAYFYASDKYTFLVTGEKEYILDRTLAELKEKLDPSHFVRIHRSVIVNVDHVKEIVGLPGGRFLCRLKHQSRELPVSRSMVKNLRQILHF
jgi:two-component system LytT family response regulator